MDAVDVAAVALGGGEYAKTLKESFHLQGFGLPEAQLPKAPPIQGEQARTAVLGLFR